MLFEILVSNSGVDKDSSPKILRLLHIETNALICAESSVTIYQYTALYVPKVMRLHIFSHTKKRSCQGKKKLIHENLCLKTSSRCTK